MEDRQQRELLEYRLLYAMCLVVHSFLCIMFFYLHQNILFVFNVFSVIMYLLGTILMRETRQVKIWVLMAYIEVVAHAAMCNLIVGYGYGFSIYAIMLIPIMYYVGFFSDQLNHGLKFYNILTISASIIIMFSCLLSKGNNLLDVMPDRVTTKVFAVNVTFGMGFLIYASTLFIQAIKRASQDLHQKNEELNFFASYDTLTKLRNRRSMREILEVYDQREDAYCMVLGDIDNFKKINDTYGHNCGDLVLQEIAAVITGVVGEQGVVCRWGGEEILILLSCEKEDGIRITERIRKCVEGRSICYEDMTVNVSMTFGFAFYDEIEGIEKLVALADDRLYVGKENGKNQVVTES